VSCARCKGNLVCGRIKCPLLEKFRFLRTDIAEGKVEKPTPPSVFVGRIGYPKILVGPLLAIDYEPEYLDSPWLWHGSIEDIIRLRVSLLRGMRRIDVSAENRFILNLQEITASTRHVDVEAEISKVIRRPLFDDVMQPMGIRAQIRSMKLAENPRIPNKVEKVYCDDLKAVDAVKYLFDSGFNTYYIQKIFSIGMLGERANRRLVPTRWSITAVHDILGEEIKKEIADFESIDVCMLFHYEHFGNHFEIVLSPGSYSFQLMEIWLKKSFWSPDSTWIGYDREDLTKKKNYSILSGGYYAARLPVLEWLKKVGRKASVTVVREIKPEYYAPLGVWVVEEGVRRALESKPEIFESFSEAIEKAVGRVKAERKWMACLKPHYQASLMDFN
jgi:hypothetical protein